MSYFKDEVLSFFIWLLGHVLHLLVTYGPPLLLFYFADTKGILSGTTIGPAVGLAVIWVFGAWFLTRKWSNWGGG